jgi:hypothetical protein
MSLDISLVPPGSLTNALFCLADRLKIASELTSGRCSVDDLVRLIVTGQYSLWLIIDTEKNTLVGFFTMELKAYPQKRLMCIQHCVTDPGVMENGFDAHMQDVMERFSKDMGCVGIEFVGRFGWKRFVNALGYKAMSTVYQKFFDGVAP